MPDWIGAVWDWMNSPIGSGLTATAIVAVLAASFRWSRVGIRRLFRWILSIRVTTTLRQKLAIEEAVRAAAEPALTSPWEEEDPADRAIRLQEEYFSVPWAIVRYFGEKNAYHLENRSAGPADEVVIISDRGFEFFGDAAWVHIEQGEYKQFLGRIARGPMLGLPTYLHVEWNDSHGDARTYAIKLD